MAEARRNLCAALLLALSFQPLTARAQTPAAALPASTGTRVVVLGTGNPNPDPDRSGPAVAVVVDGTAYLVDAGAGVMRRAESARRQGIEALAADRLGIVFLTHLHSDHTIGLPDLIQTGWVLERTRPLRVFGPPGTIAMTGHLTAAWAADLDNRRNGTQPHTPEGWKVEARDIAGGVVYRDSSVTVTAIPVIHAGWPAAFGYRFVTRDRVIVISGDARPSDALADACNGCDILVHEVYSARGFAARPPAWQTYHAGAHTSTTELATLAARARPKLLVLYHQLYWGATDDELLAEIAAGYPGRVVSARDLGVY
jgi:ribonuclease BN (tRNA processing enzyme)